MTELRVSPSQINLFLNEPAIWVLNKFHKIYGDMGASAKLGIAVEKGLQSILQQDLSFEDALNWANKVFTEDTIGLPQEDIDKERAYIEPMLKQAIEVFLQFGDPKGYQVEITGQIEDVNVLGKADFEYDFFIDLKTTKRMPSCVENLAAEHIRQLAVYRKMTGREQRLAYVTDKKNAVYTPTDAQYRIAEKEIKHAIIAMKTAWEAGHEMAQKLYPPRDYGSFYWDEKTLTAANEVWK